MTDLLASTVAERVEKATVKLQRGGQGVLVSGNFIVTAAHCIQWESRGFMTLSRDEFLEPVDVDGQTLTTTPLAVEPCMDIAVLGGPDDQELPAEFDKFEAWCESRNPLPLFTQDLAFEEGVEAYVLSHKGEWSAGQVTHFGLNEQVATLNLGGVACESGTSGGPIVTREGCLIGVVSTASCNDEGTPQISYGSSMPRAAVALPLWLLRRMGAIE